MVLVITYRKPNMLLILLSSISLSDNKTVSTPLEANLKLSPTEGTMLNDPFSIDN